MNKINLHPNFSAIRYKRTYHCASMHPSTLKPRSTSFISPNIFALSRSSAVPTMYSTIINANMFIKRRASNDTPIKKPSSNELNKHSSDIISFIRRWPHVGVLPTLNNRSIITSLANYSYINKRKAIATRQDASRQRHNTSRLKAIFDKKQMQFFKSKYRGRSILQRFILNTKDNNSFMVDGKIIRRSFIANESSSIIREVDPISGKTSVCIGN